jgi:hypothetical protein
VDSLKECPSPKSSRHGEVSGFKVLKAAMISPSDGMSLELGPSVGPHGSAAPVACFSRRADTTSPSTVATAAVSASCLAALPSRPFSTSLTAVVVLGVVPSLGLGLGQLRVPLQPGLQPLLQSRGKNLPWAGRGCWRGCHHPAQPGKLEQGAPHIWQTPQLMGPQWLVHRGSSPSERKRSSGESGFAYVTSRRIFRPWDEGNKQVQAGTGMPILIDSEELRSQKMVRTIKFHHFRQPRRDIVSFHCSGDAQRSREIVIGRWTHGFRTSRPDHRGL